MRHCHGFIQTRLKSLSSSSSSPSKSFRLYQPRNFCVTYLNSSAPDSEVNWIDDLTKEFSDNTHSLKANYDHWANKEYPTTKYLAYPKAKVNHLDHFEHETIEPSMGKATEPIPQQEESMRVFLANSSIRMMYLRYLDIVTQYGSRSLSTELHLQVFERLHAAQYQLMKRKVNVPTQRRDDMSVREYYVCCRNIERYMRKEGLPTPPIMYLKLIQAAIITERSRQVRPLLLLLQKQGLPITSGVFTLYLSTISRTARHFHYERFFSSKHNPVAPKLMHAIYQGCHDGRIIMTEKMVQYMILAHARDGNVAGVDHVIKAVYGISSSEKDPELILSSDSVLWPKVETLMTIATAYGFCGEVERGLEVVTQMSSHYNIPLIYKIYIILFKFARIRSEARTVKYIQREPSLNIVKLDAGLKILKHLYKNGHQIETETWRSMYQEILFRREYDFANLCLKYWLLYEMREAKKRLLVQQSQELHAEFVEASRSFLLRLSKLNIPKAKLYQTQKLFKSLWDPITRKIFTRTLQPEDVMSSNQQFQSKFENLQAELKKYAYRLTYQSESESDIKHPSLNQGRDMEHEVGENYTPHQLAFESLAQDDVQESHSLAEDSSIAMPLA